MRPRKKNTGCPEWILEGVREKRRQATGLHKGNSKNGIHEEDHQACHERTTTAGNAARHGDS
jgi:hypothetical protein